MLALNHLARVKRSVVAVITTTVRSIGKICTKSASETSIWSSNRCVLANTSVANVNRTGVAIGTIRILRARQRLEFYVERAAMQFGDSERQVGVVGSNSQVAGKGNRFVVGAAIVVSRFPGALEAVVAKRLVSLTLSLTVAALTSFARRNAAFRLLVKHLASSRIAQRLTLTYSTIFHFDALFSRLTRRGAFVLNTRLTRKTIFIRLTRVTRLDLQNNSKQYHCKQ